MPIYERPATRLNALQFTGRNQHEVLHFTSASHVEMDADHTCLLIHIPQHGTLAATPSDYIIETAPGRFAIEPQEDFEKRGMRLLGS